MSQSDPTDHDAGAPNASAVAKPAAKRTNLLALRQARERAVEILTERYSRDVIDEDDLEHRLEAVENATTLAEIDEQIADLQPASTAAEPDAESSQALVPTSETALATISDDAVPASRRFISIIGDSRQEGAWTPARQNTAYSVIGNVNFDFRDARLGPGEVTVNVRSLIGNVTLVVPPGMPVDIDCTTMIGDNIRYTPTRALPDDDVPRVRVKALMLIGDVRIEERLPGESKREARRRRKLEAKEEKRERKRLNSQRKRKRKRLGSGD